MPGIRALSKIQFALESTSGSAATPSGSGLWRGMGFLEDKREVKFADENVGYLSGVDRTYIPKIEGAIELADTEATFEQLPYVFACGIQNTTSPSTDGSGTGKIYAYAFPTTSANTIKTLTIQGGDNTQAEVMEYAYVDEFSISGKPGEALTVSSTWIGRQVQTTSFTGGIALPTVEEILFGKSKLYIDAVSGTIGSTLKSSTLLGFTLKCKTGWTPVYAGDGNLYFSFIKSTKPEITLDITFEHDSTAVAEKAAWRAQTGRLIRLLVQGNALTTPGTAYTYKTLMLDLAGKWESFAVIDEQDGNNIVTGTFRAAYDTTASAFATFTVVNEKASL